jgi:peptidoglycan hydrolase-like protein with peptidoglycan-binding domain
MRRSLLTAGVVTIAVGAAAAGVVVGSGSDTETPVDDDATEAESSSLEFAPVERRDLVRNEELDGTVGYGTPVPLAISLTGTLTSLPQVGLEIASGSVIAEVDGQPVIALVGSIPMWRDLGPGIEDGEDVLQLETILASLGFTEEYDVTVDADWTDATTRAVKAFQEAHGQEDDGTITRGEVVFIEAPVRVDSVGGVLGQATTDAAITVTDVDRVVNVNLDVADASLLELGDAVEVELPDGSTVPATVETVGDVTTAADGSTSIPVDVRVEGGADGGVDGGVDIPNGTPVEVLVAVVSAENVLSVPVEAVLALAEGGYAVEVRDESGATHLVGVDLGTFVDGYVEVTGDVAEGAEVVVP